MLCKNSFGDENPNLGSEPLINQNAENIRINFVKSAEKQEDK